MISHASPDHHAGQEDRWSCLGERCPGQGAGMWARYQTPECPAPFSGVVRSGGEADPTKESPSTAKYGKSHQYFRKNKLLPHIAHQGKQYCRSEEAEDEKHKEAGRRPPDGGEGHFQDPD